MGATSGFDSDYVLDTCRLPQSIFMDLNRHLVCKLTNVICEGHVIEGAVNENETLVDSSVLW